MNDLTETELLFLESIYNEDINLIKKYIKEGVRVQYQFKNPLEIMVKKQNPEIVELLLQNGAKPMGHINQYYSNIDIFKILVKYYPYLISFIGPDHIFSAIYNNKPERLEYLLSIKPDLLEVTDIFANNVLDAIVRTNNNNLFRIAWKYDAIKEYINNEVIEIAKANGNNEIHESLNHYIKN